MQQLILKLKALKNELADKYEEYLESQYQENADFISYGIEGPDFDKWTNENCLKFADWILENEEELQEEIEAVKNELYPESD